MKKLFLILIILVASVLLLSITPMTSQQVQNKDTIQQQDTSKKALIKNQNILINNQNTMIKNQNTMIKNQDSIKREVYPAKNAEYMEWQARSKQIDKNFEKMDQQSALMDSLINAKPKPVKKKTP